MAKSEKQPWNQYPLAVLSVNGLSPCAKSVLIYLGVRSNYKGETCVGHRRIMKDLVRSADFVTKGLQELYDKGVVTHADRNRSKGEAEWRTISSSVLPTSTDGAQINPAVAVDQSCLAGVLNPEEQECISPAYQCKTLQISTTPNLTDLNTLSNLTDKNNNNGVVVVYPSEEEKAKGGLVAGYSPETIAAHAEACKDNEWVQANDSQKARTKPGFVKHLMENVEPPKRVRKRFKGVLADSQYRRDSGKTTFWTRCAGCRESKQPCETHKGVFEYCLDCCPECRVLATAKPGSHAERNPELHTGVGADGKSLTAGVTKM
jgi:hypothetical protein